MELTKYYTEHAVHLYDQEVAATDDDGISTSDALKAAAAQLAKDFATGRMKQLDIGNEDAALWIMQQAIRPARTARKAKIITDFWYLQEWLTEPSMLSSIDPILDLAIPIGNGNDKTLRYRVEEDYVEAVTRRYRNASDVTAKAREFDDATIGVRSLLAGRRTGDLFVKDAA